jgi:hypothetical protein
MEFVTYLVHILRSLSSVNCELSEALQNSYRLPEQREMLINWTEPDLICSMTLSAVEIVQRTKIA